MRLAGDASRQKENLVKSKKVPRAEGKGIWSTDAWLEEGHPSTATNVVMSEDLVAAV